MAWWDDIKQVVDSEVELGQRVAKAAVTLPGAGGTVDLFTVSVGRVLLTSIVGQVTTIIDATVAADVKLTHTPTTGLAAATDMCDVLDTKPDDEDTIYTITGDVTDPLADDGRLGLVVTPSFATNQQILQPGTIKLDAAGAAMSGAIKWTLQYVPIDEGATIVAA